MGCEGCEVDGAPGSPRHEKELRRKASGRGEGLEGERTPNKVSWWKGGGVDGGMGLRQRA